MPAAAAERDVLRVVARLPSREALETARGVVLDWAEAKAGRRLPPEARAGETFEDPFGGRTMRAERFKTADADLWSFRVEDPDAAVPGRSWTTEVTIGGAADDPMPIAAVRLLVGGQAMEDIVPAVPRLVGDLAQRPGLICNGAGLVALRRLSGDVDLDGLFDLLERPERQLPVIVVSNDGSAGPPPRGDLAPPRLGNALTGLAHLVEVGSETSWRLTERYGQRLSVFGGALRVYRGGFNHFADPYDHTLYLPFRFAGAEKSDGLARHLREEAAAASLRRHGLGREVVSFHDVREARLKRLLEQRRDDRGTSDAEQVAVMEELLSEAEQQSAKLAADRDLALSDQIAAEERADEAERRLAGYQSRIENLEAQIRYGSADGVAPALLEPRDWADFADWAEAEFPGRLTLTSAARRSVKKALYESPATAARCLRLLATDLCDAFRGERGGGRLDEPRLEDGIHNTRCGGDAFAFVHQGRRLVAEWHVKNGGNTRDPRRCLRVYYAFDEQTQEIVVADMPAHRHTTAT